MKKIAFMLGIMFTCTVSSNDIYIEQSGNTSDITLTQTGVDNIIGSANTSSFMGGNNNTITINQTGSRNILNSITNGDSVTLILDYIGDDNEETINCGTNMSQGCDSTTINHNITGDSNTFVTSIKGNTTSKMVVSGSSNTITHNSTSTGIVSADLKLTGNSNVIDLIQTGTLNKSITVDSTGSNNNIAINQHN